MKGIRGNGGRWFGKTLRRSIMWWFQVDSNPQRSCLARHYANCKDFGHCRHCTHFEQVLRTAWWAQKQAPQ